MSEPSTAAAPILAVDGLTASYNGATVLWGVDLHVAEGEAVAILGPNGAGKTTLAESLAGLHRETTGTVSLAGAQLQNRPASVRSRRGLAVVTQNRDLFDSFSVAENLLLGQRARSGRDGYGIDDIYALFPALHEARRKAAGSLSGGQQQMLAIGRALLTAPRVLLLDEPSAGLAAGVLADLGTSLREIHAAGQTVLLIEQRLDFATAVCERYVMLSNGRVLGRGALSADSEAELAERYFGAGPSAAHQTAERQHDPTAGQGAGS